MLFSPFAYMAPSGDADVQAFIDAVDTAGGSLTTTEEAAINTLVSDLKSSGVWDKCNAIYPFVGSSATAHKFNLKDPRDLDAAFRLTFTGTWTHDANGAKSDGDDANYADTYWDVTVNASNDAHHVFKYATIPSTTGCGYDGQGGSPYLIMGTCAALEWFSGGAQITSGGSRTGGYAQGILRTSSTNVHFYRYLNSNQGAGWNVAATSTNAVGSITSANYTLGKINNTGFGCDDTYGLYTLGETMTQTEFSDLYDAAQTFNTTLGRDV